MRWLHHVNLGLVNRANVLSNITFDKDRSQRIINILKKIVGVYSDRDKREKLLPNIKNTILVNVLESKKYNEGGDRYKQLINNYLCYTAHHKFLSIVYIIESNATLFNIMANTIRSYDSNVFIVEYPYHLFWKCISTKTTIPNRKDSTDANYEGFLLFIFYNIELLKVYYHPSKTLDF